MRLPALAASLAPILAVLASSALFAAAPKVEIVGTPGAWTLLRDGEPFFIRGACAAPEYFDLLARSGGNAQRTYSARSVDQLEPARRAGLSVAFGLWLGHERHGFSYDDPAALERQRHMVVDTVTALRDDPAIILWNLGNEMEGDGGNPAIWKEVNHLARLIKEIDARPVLTSIAGASPRKLAAIREHCPDLDLVGINAYGGLPGVHRRMEEHLPGKPYLITEYGSPGPWERPKAAWGAELEPTSAQKAAFILAGAGEHIAGHPGRCLGGFAFRWGWKQEATHTWFSLILDDGSPTAMIDALQFAWTGRWPEHRAPSIEPLDLPALSRALAPGQRVPIHVKATAVSSDASLAVEWRVYEESRDRKKGGDAEARPAALPGLVQPADRVDAELTAPAQPGRYRLFVTVRGPGGRAATANLPFLVETPAPASTLPDMTARPDPQLPPLLRMQDGAPVATPEAWREQRRPELLELFREHIYGRAPAGRPDGLRFEWLERDQPALDGAALRHRVRIAWPSVNPGVPDGSFECLYYTPARTVPRGAAVLIIHQYRQAVYDDHDSDPGGFWPVRDIVARGYVALGFRTSELAPDDPKDGLRSGVFTTLDPRGPDAPRPADAWGAISAWAWGASRVVDFLESQPAFAPLPVVLVGHSRGGKTALWCGAQDERVALAVSNNSGTAGAALARLSRGETIRQINTVFPHWFAQNYHRYNDDPAALPVDQHALVALLAPRLGYIAGASADAHADPRAEHRSGIEAGPAYSLFGYEALSGGSEQPPVGETRHAGRVGWHLREGKHGLTRSDWLHFLDYADRHLPVPL